MSFNIKENKLIIPSKYYDLIVKSYKMVIEQDHNDAYRMHRQYNKFVGYLMKQFIVNVTTKMILEL